MKKKGLLALLLTFIMLFSSVGAVLAADEGGVGTPVWTVEDFTYDEATGTTVTGLSDIGKEKITVNSEITIPAVGPTEQAITAIGDGINMQGIFVYTSDAGTPEDTTDDKNYTPSSVVLPSTLTTIGNFAFALNPNLTYEAEMTAITFPEGLVEIGQAAFQNSKLTSVSIPDSVTTMGMGAFTGSVNLTSVKLSKNVVDIPQSAFSAGTATSMSLKEVVIPEGVQTVGRQAFHGAHVEKLTLPSTLTEIGQEAFGNHQLTEVTIPGNVKTIGKYAFRISQAVLENTLTKVVLNEGLVTIGQYAFVGSKVTELRLPSTVVLSAKNGTADLIFGTTTAPADPIVKVMVNDKSKVETFNTEKANSFSHVVVYECWISDNNGWWYQNADGSYPASTWEQIDDVWYYFDASGYMETGWQLVNGTWYYMDASGAMQTGWVYVGDAWYYLNEDGAMQTGWVLDGNTWYYLNASGAMQTGWLLDGNTWYYLDASGAMQTGWVYVGNAWYYLKSNGAMAANRWIGRYYVGADGAWVQ